jgi:thioredoxin-related protein
MVTNFSQRGIADKTRRNFVAIALNMWGDRDVTWLDGRTMTEKELARELKVQFTPTLLFLDRRGGVLVRLNGYYPPQRFEAVLDYLIEGRAGKQSLGSYLQRVAREPAASPRLHDEPFFMTAPYNLTRRTGGRPLAVVFETTHCAPCDELHRQGLRREDVLAMLREFDVARFALGTATALVTPDGRSSTAQAWARELGVAYTPSIVFFDATGAEVLRMDAYLRGFHLASSLDYVASGAYRTQPSFQRFLQARSERLRAAGERVDLWR